MKNNSSLFEEVYELAKNSIPPSKNHLDISIRKGKMLAKEYDANLDIVLFGIVLMDIKLSYAMKNNKAHEHVEMSSLFAKEFLKKTDFNDEEKEKIINCIEAHHGKIPYTCIEAEICANADCYRFIHPVGVFTYMSTLSKRTDDFIEQIKGLKFKLEEKHKLLSLPKAKEELEKYYETYSKQFDEILKYMEETNEKDN